MLHFSKKITFVLLGWCCLALAFLGVFLPLLPTTPFVLLSAFFFSKGSVRLHRWLLHQPTFGPLIADWEQSGIIRTKAKIWSTVMIVPPFIYSQLFVQVPIFVKIIVAAVGVIVLVFIWTRPSGGSAALPKS